MSTSPSGFALRKNGTCELQEVDCGKTVNPYRVCCPHASSCPSQYNVDVRCISLISSPSLMSVWLTGYQCCPTSANCTLSLIPTPRCANTTWDLYDNDGYFCCLPGLIGYAAKNTNSNGCASPGYEFQAGEVQLRLIRAGETGVLSSLSPSTSTTSSKSSTSAVESATTVPPPPLTDEGLSTGAKAGIGVGAGIGVLILFIVGTLFIRGTFRRRRSTELDGGAGQSPGEVAGEGKEKAQHASTTPELGDGHYHELDGHQVRAEVQG